MALNFPNVSRSFDMVRNCVCFWGYDGAFEVAFQVETGALRRIKSDVQEDEESLLRVFDGNRVRIQKVATSAYSKRRQSHYRLSAADF
ncbi:MAG: hypothetical protein B7Y12_03270 [Rhizobiales bacterium 24-66-13]|jgi:hypothetical protein|uniref:DUF1488 domain-containing protein n=1 Tax=Roseixanthobacter finlandensis TaxID=3119922 RepID=UPI000BD7AEE9|nr:MAG: hypothetical protein B7Y61_05735 [Rhizobiales bacterium 35-66-30]OYZ82487.1 MAG: hypothetical protein B7Y12_03270 [Rhizobiales bacterium 24-66-13]OZB11255.1 MAG: hypothetical protein B7X67_04535 [Rhizobiales bacterium 39-66-18]